MDFAGLLKGFSSVILQRSSFVEMDGDWELPGVHLDDGRRRLKKLLVFCEVLDAQSGRHDQQLHGHSFLQTGMEKNKHEASLGEKAFLIFMLCSYI